VKLLKILSLVSFLPPLGFPLSFLQFSASINQEKLSQEIYLTFNHEGKIYLSEPKVNKIKIFSSQGLFLKELHLDVFRAIKNLAVDTQGNIYVNDWGFQKLSLNNSQIYFRKVCIHKISPEGKLLKTIFLTEVSKLGKEPIAIQTAIDSQGEAVYIVDTPSYQRKLELAAGKWLYVLDQNTVYRFSFKGELLKKFSVEADKHAKIALDREGNIYINHFSKSKISKYSPQGKKLFSFGEKGYHEGQIFKPRYLRVLKEGSLIVFDSSEYFLSLPCFWKPRAEDPTPWRDVKVGKELKKGYQIKILRYQIFSTRGRYRKKFIHKLDLSRAQERSLEFIGICPFGNIFYFDKEIGIIKKYSPISKKFRGEFLERGLVFKFKRGLQKAEVENYTEPNTVPDLSWGFSQNILSVSISFSYLLDEKTTFKFLPEITFAYARAGAFYYPTGEIQVFTQSDVFHSTSFTSGLEIELKRTLEYEAYPSLPLTPRRQAFLNSFFGLSTRSETEDALEQVNKRYLGIQQWEIIFGITLCYDLTKNFSLLLSLQRRPYYFNSQGDYFDERGEQAAGWDYSLTKTDFSLGIKSVF
jgi:hypothetical protein